MLVLSRKPGETLFIGDEIKLTVIRVQGNRVRIGIEAPGECRVLRGELHDTGNVDDAAWPPVRTGRGGRIEMELEVV